MATKRQQELARAVRGMTDDKVPSATIGAYLLEQMNGSASAVKQFNKLYRRELLPAMGAAGGGSETPGPAPRWLHDGRDRRWRGGWRRKLRRR
jgi:hypothetical protein